MRAVQISRHGGPETLELVDLAEPVPGKGEILVSNRAIGLNFIDTYQRSGLYPMPLPAILGQEAAGEVAALGAGVTRFRLGDRVAYVGGGAYAEATVVVADRAVPLPPEIDFATAAGVMLKGMTAEFLTCRLWKLERGETVLVHAAAGGVGLLLVSWLRHLGLRMIGTAGTPAKAELARTRGCDEVILYDRQDVVANVRELTGGAGVRVCYDSVGAATLQTSLDCLGTRGLFVSFGNASGPVPPIAPAELGRRGSLYMTRPSLFDYIASPEDLMGSAQVLFDALRSGVIRPLIGQQRPLSEVREAHQDLEARRTHGATILIP